MILPCQKDQLEDRETGRGKGSQHLCDQNVLASQAPSCTSKKREVLRKSLNKREIQNHSVNIPKRNVGGEEARGERELRRSGLRLS